MGRYYFHLESRDGTVPDEDGQDFPDLDAALAYGVQAARSIIADDARCGQIDLHQVLRIIPSGEAAVREILFEDAVQFRGEWKRQADTA